MSKDIYDKPMMPEQCAAPPDAQTPTERLLDKARKHTWHEQQTSEERIADLERQRDAARRELAEARMLLNRVSNVLRTSDTEFMTITNHERDKLLRAIDAARKGEK